MSFKNMRKNFGQDTPVVGDHIVIWGQGKEVFLVDEVRPGGTGFSVICKNPWGHLHRAACKDLRLATPSEVEQFSATREHILAERARRQAEAVKAEEEAEALYAFCQQNPLIRLPDGEFWVRFLALPAHARTKFMNGKVYAQ